MAKIIHENDIRELLFELAKEYEVFAPALVHPDSNFSQYAFTKFNKNTKLELSYPVTILPPKEFLFPKEDTLFEFNGKEISKPKVPKRLLFGLSLEDLEGVFLLTKFFERPVRDEVFTEKKEKTIVVGADHFSPPKDIPFDLYLMKIEKNTYAGFAKTKEGQQILKNKLFKSKLVKIPSVKKKKDELLTDPDLPKILERSQKHPVWQELAEKCFGCGICSYVCPLCYCFDTEDVSELGTDKGKRVRKWDSCLLSNFGAISNYNFRPELADRIYNWYFHKFVRIPAEYKEVGCVDCNRCVIYCPAKINYRQVLKRVLEDGKAKK